MQRDEQETLAKKFRVSYFLFSVFARGVQKQRNERTQLDLGFLGFGGFLPAVQDSPNVHGYQNAAAAADKRWCR